MKSTSMRIHSTASVKLVVDEGIYEVTGYRFPLVQLLWLVCKHRSWHWWRGEGWGD